MIYELSLWNAGLLLGLFLVVTHLIALLHADGARQLAQRFPRSRVMGIVLLSLAAIWAFRLVATIDLGEFSPWRGTFQIIVVAGYFLTVLFVEEFLAVRALGMLCLLAAEPLLEAAFLRPEYSRLFITVLAYVWVVLGLFWVGMPHLLRDQIAFISRTAARWRLAAAGGLAYGVVVLICTFAFYGK